MRGCRDIPVSVALRSDAVVGFVTPARNLSIERLERKLRLREPMALDCSASP
jgi:hypothetical protein